MPATESRIYVTLEPDGRASHVWAWPAAAYEPSGRVVIQDCTPEEI